ncbi:MAG TPA: exonuclease domain-containing protein [Tenuifilaceae bacterium]|nr:exonuclease domain-containing protein [Tenuifilaceae bacterium]
MDKKPIFAVVDIETTGGSAQKHRITEVAVFLFDGQKVVDQFVSLVNPESFIPPNIVSITGITNQMVSDAPKFFEVAKRIVEITQDAVFVAHNASFDYRFIQAEFKRLGYDYSRKTLCTVKLSRKYLPGYQSYSLGNLCANLGIPIEGRHRAGGDAKATVSLLKLLLNTTSEVEQLAVGNSVARVSNVNPKVIDDLPEMPGVYYFYNEQGELLYIGKSINIRRRVLDHFASIKTKRAAEMLSQLSDVGFEETGSELIALILEADAIKKHLPKYNKRGRRKANTLGLFSDYDINGYINFSIEKISAKNDAPIIGFDTADEAKTLLYRLVEQFALCQKLCGLYQSESACFHFQVGQCKGACVGVEQPAQYNTRAQNAINSLNLEANSFFVIDRGRADEELSFVKVVRGKIEGYGYFLKENVANSTDLLDEPLTLCGNHREAIQALKAAVKDGKARIIEF